MRISLLNIVFLLLLPVLGMAAEGFVIKGKVTGVISGTVVITRFIHLTQDEKNEEIPPKVRITNGEFIYTGKLEHPALVELKVSTMSMYVYLENTSYSLDCSLDSLSGTKLKGGKLNDDWQQFQDTPRPSLEYIKLHPNSEIAAYLALRDHTSTLEKATAARALLSQEALNTWSGQRLDIAIAALTKASTGNAFPDLAMTDAKGRPFPVKSLAGKIVVFDFWASWCSPCRAYIPTLREHYKKFKAKGVQFVSISVDDDKEKWHKAMQELGMEWMQTLAAGGFQDGKGVKEALHIFYIPHVIVMGKDGKIAASLDYSKKDQLEKILEGLL
ncbi:MAG: AhpC/TSA family protein [Chitinophaga sp.]|uniref:TlpA disulfide reductase family protein n=1 Tax=Chitinophaga sp. TaxID=1869181 RepID=UPI001B138EB3|nr:TlpA disulfide reductase family protein [Chitinophaga sp.]MBO9732117.1 AhpC/TSA family protein [Chitinophaga sp.]